MRRVLMRRLPRVLWNVSAVSNCDAPLGLPVTHKLELDIYE